MHRLLKVDFKKSYGFDVDSDQTFAVLPDQERQTDRPRQTHRDRQTETDRPRQTDTHSHTLAGGFERKAL